MKILSNNIQPSKRKIKRQKGQLRDFVSYENGEIKSDFRFIQTEIFFKSIQEVEPNPVLFKNYGVILNPNSQLKNVATIETERNNGFQQSLHLVAANRFTRMRNFALRAGFDFRIERGFTVGDPNVRNSFATGLVFDLGFPKPLERNFDKITEIKSSNAYSWLVNNAWKFGFSNNLYEPWSWECLIPRLDWYTAVDSTTYFEAGKLVERRIDTNRTTVDSNFLLDY